MRSVHFQNDIDVVAIPNRDMNDLDDKTIHLWCFSLDGGSRQVSGYERILSGNERERASRFRFEEDRTRYVVAHGALRIILGTYLHREPQSILFNTSEAGKPEIIWDRDEPLITFNLSHSGAAVLVGVAKARCVGVDIERISPVVDVMSIAETYFNREEIEALRTKPEGDQYGLFYSLWACKEAYLKAIGCGLSGGLQVVSLSDMANGWTRGICAGRRQTDHWTIQPLNLFDGYAAAVAFEDSGLDIRLVNYCGWGALLKNAEVEVCF